MLWLRAFHIISIVMWFAGLFYLPRLFVYHSMTQDEVGNARFKIMEKKLYVMTTIGFFLQNIHNKSDKLSSLAPILISSETNRQK